MSIARKKIKLPKDFGLKISKAKKGKRVDSIFTEERNSKLRKPIIQFDLDGNFIKEWTSYRQAKTETKIGMSDALRGVNKTAGGFIWKKVEDLNDSNYDKLNKKLIKE